MGPNGGSVATDSGQQEKNESLFTCSLIIFCRVSLYIKNRRGLVNIPFNRYSKLYGVAGKLTTHGSQHFHKPNDALKLKAVAFLSTDESPQVPVDTHIRTQVLVCARHR